MSRGPIAAIRILRLGELFAKQGGELAPFEGIFLGVREVFFPFFIRGNSCPNTDIRSQLCPCYE